MNQNRKAGGCTKLVMGVIFIVAGACVALFLGFDVTLTCKRPANTCVLEKTGLFGTRDVITTLPLDQLKSAEVESKQGRRNGNGSGKPTYRVVLHTEGGTVPVSQAWTNNKGSHRKTASEINAFLASQKEDLTVVESGKTIRMVGWLFFAAGCLSFLGGIRGMFRTLFSFGRIVSRLG